MKNKSDNPIYDQIELIERMLNLGRRQLFRIGKARKILASSKDPMVKNRKIAINGEKVYIEVFFNTEYNWDWF